MGRRSDGQQAYGLVWSLSPTGSRPRAPWSKVSLARGRNLQMRPGTAQGGIARPHCRLHVYVVGWHRASRPAASMRPGFSRHRAARGASGPAAASCRALHPTGCSRQARHPGGGGFVPPIFCRLPSIAF